MQKVQAVQALKQALNGKDVDLLPHLGAFLTASLEELSEIFLKTTDTSSFEEKY
ncbi:MULTISPECIES: hypothetical protein [Legionella]|uniref:hypothetical protein n=1 Tax=Legionella TaxID=445 RepID=UPI001315061F|nr:MULTISPECIES: hypothetical protein [Legionella]MCP0914514.1 hypothetical protein [Legionella sp. 27cVA30]